MAKEPKREAKRSRHTGAKVTGAAVILAALLAGSHFGLGIGRGDGGGLLPGPEATAQPATVVQETQTEETAPAEDGVLFIVVQEDGILYEGGAVTLTELEDALLRDYAEGVEVRLQDDHAIKAAYDEVSALLEKLSIPFTAE